MIEKHQICENQYMYRSHSYNINLMSYKYILRDLDVKNILCIMFPIDIIDFQLFFKQNSNK
jgi:hypothetical protein